MSQSDQQRHPARDGAGAPGGASQGQSPARGAPDAVPRSGAALMSRSRWTWCSATVPRDRGATSDLISTDPEVGAGVAFVRLEADPDPVRVRAAWVSDADIRAMADQCTAPVPDRELRAIEVEAAV